MIKKVCCLIVLYREKQYSEELNQVSVLRERLKSVDARLSEQANSHREVLKERNGQIEILEEKLRRFEMESERLKAEETSRLAALQAAVMTYIQTSGTRSALSSPRK